MAVDFPSSPTVGQRYTYLGVTYQFDGAKWVAGGAEAVDNLAFGIMPGGRLTCISGTPVDDGQSSTARTAIYYTPYIHDIIPIWDGLRFQPRQFSEITLALDSNTGHTYYHATAGMYDLYVADMSFMGGPSLVLCSTGIWSGNTRTIDPVRVDGVLVNEANTGVRWSANVSDFTTLLAGYGTYVGTMWMSANGQTKFYGGGVASGGAMAELRLWNHYNRRAVSCAVVDNGAAFSYFGAARAYRASSTMRINVVNGYAEDTYMVQTYARMDLTAGAFGTFYASLDTTGSSNIFPNGELITTLNAQSYLTAQSYIAGGQVAFLGAHFISMNQAGNNANDIQWNGAGPAAMIAAIPM